MGYSFSVDDPAVQERYRKYHPELTPIETPDGREEWEDMSGGTWDYDFPPTVNSKALGLSELPDHINAAKFSAFDPPAAQRLSDAIELQLLTSEEVRRGDRASQLWDLIDWLRYWAAEGKQVSSG